MRARPVSFGICDLKVMRNFRASAFSIGWWFTSGFCSSGTMCVPKNSTMLIRLFVVVAPRASVFPMTVRAMTRYRMQSLAFQFSAGFCACWAKRVLTYCEQIPVTFSGNLEVRALTSSQALRRLVSLSLPSMSRRMYSTKFISNSSSSSSRTCMLGSATRSTICTRLSSVPKTLAWCTLLETVVRNLMAVVTISSCLFPIVVCVRRFHTSSANE
mmetsp:Transcript_9357/g.26261  ORF Transcript_9357/g.26261 Transcript_9357/m.26261 type:complete len:214 (-) Transcript_9357:657-1298(-)